ncbi:MAG: DUF4440 domain-containing protein [Pyrinomonadaceae bacterium]
MKRFLPLTVALCFFSGIISAQTANKNGSQVELDKQELIRLTNELSRASVDDDAATLERLMDDNLVYFGNSNKSKGKATLIKQWTRKASDPTASSSSTPSDFQVYVYGTAAIVVSQITDVSRNKNGETTLRTFDFDVWKKTDKGWRWIASRETILPQPKAITVDPKTLDDYAGAYRSENGSTFTIARDGDKLTAAIPGSSKFDLSPQSEIEFFSPLNSALMMIFVRDNTGQIAYAILRYNGVDTTLKKLK